MRLPKPAAGIRTLLVEAAVVILSYNHPELSSRAALSARSLGCNSVTFVHNGSEERHVKLLKKRFPEMNHLILEENRGYAGGVNAGLKEAFVTHDWTILLTNDSTLSNLPVVPEEPCIIAPKVLRRQTDRIDSLGGLFFPARGKLRRCRTSAEFVKQYQRGLPYIPGTCFLAHRNVFLLAGPLREELCIYWDDVEWSQRIRASGVPLKLDENWIVRHGLSKTGAQNPKYSLYYFQRNRKLISWEFTPAAFRPLLVLCLCLDWLRLVLKNILRGRFRALPFLFRAIVSPAGR